MAGMSLQPTVEDYYSSDSDNDSNHALVLESTRRSSGNANANANANMTAKRSHPSDLGNDKSPPVEQVAHIDLQSDSGYSSHYAGTMSSADSALSSPPTSSASIPPASPPIVMRRPTINNDRKPSSQSSQSSPRNPLQRSGSVSTRKPKERRRTQGNEEDCNDPNCHECIPIPTQSTRGRRPKLLDSALDLYNPRLFDPRDQRDQRSEHSDPAPSYISSPQSPTYTRPGPYVQGSAVVQPASTPRRPSSTNRPARPARPLSYHGGDPASYWNPTLQASMYQNGPPPSMSAHFSTMHQPSQMASYHMPPHPSTYYAQGMVHPMQTPPPYDAQQRPSMASRGSSHYNTRDNRGRPVSGYGPTVVTQEQPVANMPSARYPTAGQNPRERPVMEQYDSESSSEYTEEEEEEVQVRNGRNDRKIRALMPPPPPPIKTPVPRRPSLRHAATTQVYNTDRRMSQSQTLPERPKERDPRPPTRVSTAAPSRVASVSRPALVQNPKAQSAYESNRNAQIVVENPRSIRRQSYQGYDKQFEAEEKERRRNNRTSRIYSDPKVYAIENKRSSKNYAEEPPRNQKAYTENAVVPARRRQTVSGARRREDKLSNAEAYLQSTRGLDEPIVDKVHRAAKRASRVPSEPSEAESAHSKGSDKASRVSMSNRTTVTNGGGSGEIRLRVDTSTPLSLQFNGDMEGRTLHINPVEDGMADIVIGNPGSREAMYRSERGSVLGRPKAIMPSDARDARRETEEASVRSERTSRTSRRSEGDRRVLQRRRREYEYN
ncbi:hypothetical protein K504DRAFT_849 [Pleomassaria siparia CBS 279.74]|uniref:Uncharacterized protein n=1 Tax=Pleomassaria siparia CBS 279.74 TaxID=1314801 RepID=A0A6G1KPC9_9PLEO|nr:hypothetical protein K504DRAFT_849 [Pleomassaria siparia CBS 279.74]